MSFRDPPTILRIKRKRTQDPLQALILEDRNRAKRSKPSSPTSSAILTPPEPQETKNLYFALTRTDESTQIDDQAIQSVLSEAAKSPSKSKRKFIIPKRQIEEDVYIPNELSDMVSSLLMSSSEQPVRKRRIRGRRQSSVGEESRPTAPLPPKAAVQESLVYSDYVYDVYQLSSTEPLTDANHPQSQIGYIRFFEDEDTELNQSDDDNDASRRLYSDDEDSNAESFYQNDYPSDEDAGVYSETYSSDEDDLGPVIVQDAAAKEGYEYLQGNELGEYVQRDGNDEFDDLYDDFYDEEGGKIDFLGDDKFETESFERQNFFEGEEDDELAIHRDRIFGKLQRIIDES